MTKRTIAGVVIIVLYLLQHCSATNITTMVTNDETSTSGTVTPSTSEQINMTKPTTIIVSEYSDGYVQNGNPEVSTTVPVSATTISASVERSEQVANASPTTQHPKVEETSTNPSLPSKDNETYSGQNILTSTEHPSTLFPIQNDTSLSNKSSDALVSSSKVNIADSGNKTNEESDLDTADRGSIAEKEVPDPYETETQPTVTVEEKIENEAATSPPDDLTRAGVKIGDADVRDDDGADDYEKFFETSSTMKNDSGVEKNGTTVATAMYFDNTTNLTLNDQDGIEVLVLADDMVEPEVQADSRPISSAYAVTSSPAEDVPTRPNETTHPATTSSSSRTSGMDNIASSPITYASGFNGTDEKTNPSESDANLFPPFNLPSFAAPNNDFGNENNSNVQQQTNSSAAKVPSDSDNLSTTTQEYDGVSLISELFGVFEQVQLLADDKILDNPEGQSINEYSELDQKPIEEINYDRNPNTESSLSVSNGITSECDTSPCENYDDQTTPNSAADTTGSFPEYTPNDQENMSPLQNTSVGAPSGHDSQPFKDDKNITPALDATVGDTRVETPDNDSDDLNVPRNVPDEGLSEPEPVTEKKIAESSMESNPSPPIPGSESQVPEVVEDKPLPSDETQTVQKSTPQGNYSTQSLDREITQGKEFTTNGKMLKKMFTVPMDSVLHIHLKIGGNQESVPTEMPQISPMPQEHASTEDNDGYKQLERESVPQDYAKEIVEVLADDITFGEDEKEADEDRRPKEENLEQLEREPVQEDVAKEVVEVLADDITFGEDEKEADEDRRPKEENLEQLEREPVQEDVAKEIVEVLADDITFGEDEKGTDEDSRPMEENLKDSYITTTTFRPYFVSDIFEPNRPSAKCPFSARTSDTKVPKEEQQRTVEHRPEGHIVEDPYYYEVDPFCLTRHHVLIPVVPVILPQWCFVPDTPDFMCPRYDLGFHIAFAHETQRDMYYRCVYGQAVLLKCPNLHYWDDERKICTLMTDFSHYQRYHYHPSRNLYDQTTHHHCQHCRRNFLLPQDLDPAAQCSDRMLLACNTDGTLSVYECPGFYYYDRQIQLRWYADVERCDYPADGDGPWR